MPFKARIAQLDEPGTLKDRLDEAWQSVKLGLVRAVSIGFRPLEWTQMADGGYRFSKWKWVELSLVTIPANSQATIDVVRSVDRITRAASGTKSGTVRITQAGASASEKTTPKPNQGSTMLTKQLQAAEAKRAANSARMQALMKAAQEDGERTLDAAEAEEFDNLEAENATIEAQIRRLNVAIKSAGETATPVAGQNAPAAAAARNPLISMKSNLPKGAGFTRYVQALVACKGDISQAERFSQRWTDTPEVNTVLKAAVAAGTTSDATWAGNLVPEYTSMSNEFVELLRPLTVFDKMTGARRVPFRTKVPTQTSGSTAHWVGEASPKPLSALGFGQVTLDEHKVAGIVVISQELARSSRPDALTLIQGDLLKAVAQRIDETLLDPAAVEVSGVSPASITNAASNLPASGITAAALRLDVQELLALYLDGNQAIDGLTWVMTPSQALAISMMQNALGQPEFSGITAMGGTFFGLPVVVSNNVPVNTSGGHIILVNQSDILVADDGVVTIDVSNQASLQMSDTPAAGAQQLVSLFQNNLVAVRAERFLTWKRARATAVAYIYGANYRA